ncbi:hypothetical protein GCM10023170_083310 [Phytohabitans houttuyneae]|uniref:phage tail sheath family protein n=1 Tax=Phytohabitans houttuyneae TaxID=1076126 RepID=UPI0031F1710E
MPNYAAPGVFVEEVPGGARPIGAVGTSTAGFIGHAPDRAARVDEAVAVNSWTEFLTIFCGPANNPKPPETTHLANAVYGFFDNGGSRCYVVNIGKSDAITGTGRKRTGLQVLETIDEIAIVAAPGFTDPAAHEALLSHCERLAFPVAILDPPSDVDNIDRLVEVATAGETPAPGDKPAKAAAAKEKPADGDEGAAAGAPGEAAPSAPAAPAKPAAPASGGLRPRQSDQGTFYFPWIKVRDPLGGQIVTAPPSGHMAGTWARTDATRGVHKAPANEPLRGALDVTYRVTRQEQEKLNPQGVNCIRYFAAEGIRVWGARTLAAEASEWRYINVRRLFNAVGRSIELGTGWMVFEPNDLTLWKSIRRDITAFLTSVWRDGALMGRTPQEAFFVKCDEETNPADQRDQGRVIALIGLAVVKPAEFVIFRLSQWAGGAQTDVMGG